MSYYDDDDDGLGAILFGHHLTFIFYTMEWKVKSMEFIKIIK